MDIQKLTSVKGEVVLTWTNVSGSQLTVGFDFQAQPESWCDIHYRVGIKVNGVPAGIVPYKYNYYKDWGKKLSFDQIIRTALTDQKFCESLNAYLPEGTAVVYYSMPMQWRWGVASPTDTLKHGQAIRLTGATKYDVLNLDELVQDPSTGNYTIWSTWGDPDGNLFECGRTRNPYRLEGNFLLPANATPSRRYWDKKALIGTHNLKNS